jgi:tungstate transport system permease protein
MSLIISFSATAAAVGLPFGAALVICRFPARQAVVLLASAFLGLAPIVVGLRLYLALFACGGSGRTPDPVHAGRHGG